MFIPASESLVLMEHSWPPDDVPVVQPTSWEHWMYRDKPGSQHTNYYFSRTTNSMRLLILWSNNSNSLPLNYASFINP